MFDIFWANKQVERFYTTITLFLTNETTGVVYRYEKGWLGHVTEAMMSETAQLEIDQLSAQIAANLPIEEPIVYEEGLV